MGQNACQEIDDSENLPSTRISCSGFDLDSETKPRCSLLLAFDLGRHPRDISFGCVPVPTKQGKGAYYLTIALSHNAYVYLNISINIYVYRERRERERERDIHILYVRVIYSSIHHTCVTSILSQRDLYVFYDDAKARHSTQLNECHPWRNLDTC